MSKESFVIFNEGQKNFDNFTKDLEYSECLKKHSTDIQTYNFIKSTFDFFHLFIFSCWVTCKLFFVGLWLSYLYEKKNSFENHQYLIFELLTLEQKRTETFAPMVSSALENRFHSIYTFKRSIQTLKIHEALFNIIQLWFNTANCFSCLFQQHVGMSFILFKVSTIILDVIAGIAKKFALCTECFASDVTVVELSLQFAFVIIQRFDLL